ncbi:MAG TPA: hypothetical protein PK624_05775 [Spirochaetota bacterium]|nr:hypothetical protein [Spirochaetota bacterium]HOR44287.1 hypothetical protein [Spirochaetota bacterium]HOU85235.1 hypothetical protein [Spirochaetota bacterium]HPK55767.1 hypothetical protein [Spirochaetota bacterium]HQE57813.1 hypothetical protein [Spirochaetota bacterium]
MKLFLLFSLIFISCSGDEIQDKIPDDVCGIMLIIPSDVAEGESFDLKSVILKRDGTRTIAEDVNYTVSDELLVSILHGKAVFLKPGNVVVTASVNGYTDSCDVQINKKINYYAVKIYSVMYNPSGADSGKEFISIKNTWDGKISLKGFALGAGASSCALGDAEIAPGEILYYCQDGVSAMSLHSINSSGELKFTMRNSGETVKLFRNDLVIDCVYIAGGSKEEAAGAEWGSAGLPVAKEGNCIKRQMDTDTDTFADWIESSDPF